MTAEATAPLTGEPGDQAPRTDPSRLTDSAVERAKDDLRREMAAQRELLEARLSAMDKATELLAATVGRVPSDTDKAVSALRELLGARIDGMDIATKLLAAKVDTVPSDVDRAVTNLRDVIMGAVKQVELVSQEKFTAIEGTFASNALALTAALAAQKEAAAEAKKSSDLAIDKSEKTTQETIRANDAKTASSIGAQAATMDDIKQRVVRIESGGLATAAARTDNRADATYDQAAATARAANLRATIGIAVAAASMIIALIAVIALFAAKSGG